MGFGLFTFGLYAKNLVKGGDADTLSLVLSGLGGIYWNQQRNRLKDIVPQGGSVWTFALID